MTPFRAATWNIRKAVGLDRRRDPARVISVIGGLGAQIVALQEADRRLGERPAALSRADLETGTGLRVVDTGNGPSLGWHGNAILMAPDFLVERIERIDLPGLEPRGALMVETRRDGRHMRIVGTHLGLVRRHRRRQLQALVDLLRARGPAPTLILGDFNEWSQARGLEPLSGEFVLHETGHSFHAARPVAALDRIATCAELTLLETGIHDAGRARIASDHLPVWGVVAPAASDISDRPQVATRGAG